MDHVKCYLMLITTPVFALNNWLYHYMACTKDRHSEINSNNGFASRPYIYIYIRLAQNRPRAIQLYFAVAKFPIYQIGRGNLRTDHGERGGGWSAHHVPIKGRASLLQGSHSSRTALPVVNWYKLLLWWEVCAYWKCLLVKLSWLGWRASPWTLTSPRVIKSQLDLLQPLNVSIFRIAIGNIFEKKSKPFAFWLIKFSVYKW